MAVDPDREPGQMNMAADAALHILDVTKRFGGVTAVQSASLNVHPGSVHGLIGPNGAGKSTMIGLISGFIRPDSGEIRFAGTSLVGNSPAGIAKLGISRTFQQATPFSGLTVIENVMVGMHLDHHAGIGAVLFRTLSMRREAARVRAEAERLLDQFDLSDLAGADAAALPFGKLRFLEIARAVAMRPKILLLDEPAAGLNHVETERLSKVIRGLTQDGVGVLLVDHDVPFVFGLCKEVTVMNFGSVVASGAAEKVYREPAVREAYLGVSTEQEEAQ
jgi:ABC-type branched-subunit amino acid transport system ATPase component